MIREEVIELLESLKGDTIWEGIFNERIDEVIKELHKKNE